MLVADAEEAGGITSALLEKALRRLSCAKSRMQQSLAVVEAARRRCERRLAALLVAVPAVDAWAVAARPVVVAREWAADAGGEWGEEPDDAESEEEVEMFIIDSGNVDAVEANAEYDDGTGRSGPSADSDLRGFFAEPDGEEAGGSPSSNGQASRPNTMRAG